MLPEERRCWWTMKWNKIFFLSCLLFIIWGCDSPKGPINPPDIYIYGGKITDIEKIYVDKVSVEESLNVARINLPLSGGNANKITTWEAVDPDDPATDVEWVDPNDEFGEIGDDNGYLGSVELDDFFPVILPTFHTTKSDAYNEDFPWTSFFSDEDGGVSLFMRVYPDKSIYEGYHPGDNFRIQCVLADTAYYSDTIYAWKKMRIEYDYMEECTLSTVGFTAIERTFRGKNIYGGIDKDSLNHRTYLEFRDDSRQDSVHLWRSEKNLTRKAFDFNIFDQEVTSFCDLHRSNSDKYPFYLVGACSVDNAPRKIYGSCASRVSGGGSIYTPFISCVYTSKIVNDFGGSLNSWQLKTLIGLVSSHELGHFAAKLSDAYEEPWDHTDAVHCIMTSGDQMEQNLRNSQNMFFCPACIYRFRGNMYIMGPQVF
jgi:hypothetical protein